MRSRKLDLDDVVALFEGWRANKQGRLIPAELWRAALGLLDRYSPTAICRRLRLSPARFKEVREAGVPGGSVEAAASRAAAVTPRALPVRTSRSVLVPRGPVFAELPEPGMLGGGLAGAWGPPPVVRGYRVVLEGEGGTLTLVARGPGEEWLEGMCGVMVGALGSRRP